MRLRSRETSLKRSLTDADRGRTLQDQELRLDSTVFVAFAGEELNLNCELDMPANQSSDDLSCYDPFQKHIYSCPVAKSDGLPQKVHLTLELKNVTASGEYRCEYKTAKVYWYLRVGSNSHRDHNKSYFTEVTVVASFTGLLLLFSVVSSVYVFRGYGKNCHTKCVDCGRKRKQKREERKEGETEDNVADVITSPTTSFYASLETRPRSIYDVLDHSAANREPDRSKAKPKKKEPKKKEPRETVAQTAPDQHEGVFECVYENF